MWTNGNAVAAAAIFKALRRESGFDSIITSPFGGVPPHHDWVVEF
jgi:hypothetical protein